jgi:hypothetical protein
MSFIADSFLRTFIQRKKLQELMLVVQWLSCLPLYPRFAGPNLAMDDGFLRAIKIHGTPSVGGEVKPSAPCPLFYGMLKTP